MPSLKDSYGEYEEAVQNGRNSLGHVNPAFVGTLEDYYETDKKEAASTRYPPLPDGVNTPHQETTVKDSVGSSNALKTLRDEFTEKQAAVRPPERDGASEGQQPSTTNAKPIVRTQVLGALLAAMTQFALGPIIGLPGVILSQLTDLHSPDLYLDTNQVALFGSLVHIGAVVGSIAGGLLNVHVGQRVTLLLAMPFSLALWLALSFTSAVWLLLLIRAMLGVTQGLVGAASSNYVVELSDSKLRGRLTGFVETGRQTGFLLVYIVGSLDLTWRQVILVCGCITTIPPFVGLLFMPNSPRWLVTRGRLEEARKSLVFFRGSHYDVQPELTDIIDQFNMTTKNKKSFKDQLQQMRAPSVFRRLVFLAFLMIVVQFTGNISIATYVVPIFQASNSDISSYVSAILVGTIRVVGTVVFLLVVDRVGRRNIVFVTCTTCATTLMALGVYFFLQHRGVDLSNIGWLPLTVLMLYTPFVCAVQAVTSLLRAELLPTSIRATAAAFMYVIFFTAMFTVTQTFPAMVETTGEHGAFWIYGGVCVLIALVVGFTLPETRGLSLEQIDDLFRHGKHTVNAIDSKVSSVKIP